MFGLTPRDLPKLLALTLAYWAAAEVGLHYAVIPGAGTAVWPAAGVAFAALLLGGPKYWPGVFVGRLLAAVSIASPQPLWADALIAAGTTLGGVIPALAMRRLADLDPRLGRLREMMWLILGGGLGGALISAAIGVMALWASGTPASAAPLLLLTWGLGFFVGVVVFGGLILSWSDPVAWRMGGASWAHLTACLAVVAAVAWGIFMDPGPMGTWHLFPALVWAALAFSVRGAAAGLAISTAMAVAGTVTGTSPVAVEFADPALQLLTGQQFVVTTAATILILAAVADERRGQARLRASERQFRAVFELAGVGLAQADPQGRLTRVNPRYCEILGRTEAELLGHPSSDFVHPDDRAHAAQSFERMLSGGSVHLIEKRFVTPAGAPVWVRSNAVAIRDESGRAVGALSAIDDITDQRQAQEALHDETAALETLNATGVAIAGELDLDRLVQQVTDAGVALTGARFGAFFYNLADENGDRLTLYALSGAPREAFEGFDHPRATPVFAPTFEGREAVRSDDITCDPRYGRTPPHFGMPKGHLPVRSYLAVPVKVRGGETLGGLFVGHPEPAVFTGRAEQLAAGLAAQAAVALENARLYAEAQREIAERARAEEHQRLLIHELNHRVKNSLATVQSIAAQTLRSAGDLRQAKEAFTSRLLALAAAHDVLTRESWEGADLRDVVAAATDAFEAAETSRFRIEGPPVRLPPKAALSLAMALHELGTNAAKYGALSTLAGRVEISWSVHEEDRAGQRLVLIWREMGGPAVSPPERKGFGSRLIERGLAADLGGAAEIYYEPRGVVCRIEALLAAG